MQNTWTGEKLLEGALPHPPIYPSQTHPTSAMLNEGEMNRTRIETSVANQHA